MKPCGESIERLMVNEYISFMPRDASMPHDIEPVGDNKFRISGQTVRLPTYEEIVTAINRLREDWYPAIIAQIETPVCPANLRLSTPSRAAPPAMPRVGHPL